MRLGRKHRRRFFTAFVAVWMSAQVLPVTLCRLLQPAMASAERELPKESGESHSEATHAEKHCHPSADPSSHPPVAEDQHRDTGGLTAAADGPWSDCCDDPLAGCCLDGLRSTVLASKDGTGVEGDFLAEFPPLAFIVSIPALGWTSVPLDRVLTRPPPLRRTTILQI